MKNHILTIVLLLIAATAFTLRYFANDTIQGVCDILAFALPTLAAVVEVLVSEKSGKKIETEINKRAKWETISQEEYERRKAEGTLDETTYYATTEE
jgi:hypothetical protein